MLSHSSTETQDEVECGLLLDIVFRDGATVFQLFACDNEALLAGGNAFLVLDLCLHIIDRARCLHVQCDRLPRQGLHEDLHGWML